MSQPQRAEPAAPEPEAPYPPGFVPPPRGDELPTEDGEPMESGRHYDQAALLIQTLRSHWSERQDFYVAGNMFLYFSALQAKQNDFRGPDVFVVLDTEKRDRRSWVVWEEGGRRPSVVIELTSDSTRDVDYEEKKRVYGHVLQVPEYFIYDPRTSRLDDFRLATEGGYAPIPPGDGGRLPSDALGLELGVWQGVYQDSEAPWLRWHTAGGELVPTPEERAAEAERKEQAAKEQAAEAKEQAAELSSRLAAYEARFGALDE